MKARKRRIQLIYTNKLLDILDCDFISATKVSNFQSDIKKLLGYAEWMTNSYDDCIKNLNKVQNELDSIKREYKIEKREPSKEESKGESKIGSGIQLLSKFSNMGYLNMFSYLNIQNFNNEAFYNFYKFIGSENEILNCKLYSQIKAKIEKCMGIQKKEKLLSTTLTQILKEAITYKFVHAKLIKLVIELLISLGNPATTNLFLGKAEAVIRRILIDFLFRFKDKHPFSDADAGKVMDVFDTVMDFMFKYGLEPSESLKEEYRECETNKRLTTLPSYEYLCSKFENGFPIEMYEFMKMRFESRHPFVFYFDPDMQLEEKFGINIFGNRVYSICFYSKGTKKSIGAAFYLDEEGLIFQGYCKDDKKHNYARYIYKNGDIYEGGWNMGKWHGKGEYEFYESGEREIGQWVNDKEEGEHKCYDTQGNITIKHYKDGELVEN